MDPALDCRRSGQLDETVKEVELTIVDLAGSVALLLWGLHMVRTGIIRAYGAELRGFLGSALKNRLIAFLAGIGVTALLQSSTATGLMTASFTADGIVGLVPGLAIMLGANVGTALIVLVLSFDVSRVYPLLLIVGLLAFRYGGRTRTKDLGRVALGLGLMLLALHMLVESLGQNGPSPLAESMLSAIGDQPLLCIVVAAALAWAIHSSVVVLLLVMSLAQAQIVSPYTALALVAGANLGSAINPLVEGSTPGNPATRRLPVGNLINRVVGCAAVLAMFHPLGNLFSRVDHSPARMTAEFHIAFNAILAMVFLLPLPRVAALLVRYFPEQRKAEDTANPIYLDRKSLDAPAVALACAARETLRIGDIVQVMLTDAMKALLTNDRKLVSQVSRMDNDVDHLHEAVKLYVTEITRESLGEGDSRRAMEIISFDINLEHIGDIVDRNLLELASKKIKRKLQFSKEGAAELEAFHRRVLESLKLALSAFVSGDVGIARRLIEEKSDLRRAEVAAADSHLARLREGRAESVETSSLHLDILRDLRRIHSHICSVAYPVLEAIGEVQSSRPHYRDSDPTPLVPNANGH